MLKRLAAVLFAALLLSSGAFGEESRLCLVPEETEITPALRSTYTPAHEDGCFWCTPMNITDEEAVWKMLTSDIVVVNLDQRKHTVLYAEPDENSEPLGMITGSSQGVHVLEEMDDWTLIETYSTSFFDSKVKNYNAFVTGWIKSDMLKTVPVNQEMGIVVDKMTQRLYFFHNGHLETELAVSTGLYNDKQPYNETRSGEFLLISATGAITSEKLICDLALRYNDDDYLHEVPHVKNADGTRNYKTGGEGKLGTRASHGCIRTQRLANRDGANMKSIYTQIKKAINGKKPKVKFVIWEDYAGRAVRIPDDSLTLYYNPNGGSLYHSTANCPGVRKKFLPLTAFTYGELEEGAFAKLDPCPNCQPSPRKDVIEKINEAHATDSPGEVMSFWPGAK